MMPLDLDALEGLAKAATPGPWKSERGIEGWCVETEAAKDKDGGQHVACYCFAEAGYVPDADAAFIAAMNPQTVLALIAEVRELRSTLAEMVNQHGGNETYLSANESACESLRLAGEMTDEETWHGSGFLSRRIEPGCHCHCCPVCAAHPMKT
jgi:hypothetical protein